MITETGDGYVLENEHARFQVACEGGFELRGVTDRTTGADLLAEAAYFEGVPLSLRVQAGEHAPTFYPGSALTVASVGATERDDGDTLEATLDVPDGGGPRTTVTVDLPPDSPLAEWTVAVEGDGVEGLLTFPDLQVAVDGALPGWGMIPFELGVSGPLGPTEGRIGIAKEHFVNTVPFGVVGAGPEGPSLAVVGLLPDATSLHLEVDRDGRFRGKSRQFGPDGGERQVVANALLGPVGRWQDAADAYRERTRAPPPATAPDWLREAGGLYGFDGGGGGSAFLGFPRRERADWADYDHGELAGHVDSFEELPDLLDNAEACGTNVLLLWDYWEDAGDGQIPYANKGDYVPRADLGGERAFEAGIDALHERGGRVLAYVEPFIAHLRSDVGLAHGEGWSFKGPTGEPRTFYHKQWTLCPSVEGWQAHVVDVSKRLVGEYGVDGIYLDSYGLQWGYVCYDARHGHEHTGAAFDEGVIELTRKVREGIRELRPDAVVVTESHNDRLARTIDAGLDGSFHWPQYAGNPQPPLERSPLSYVHPGFQTFSGSTELTHVHQAYAAGQGIVLAPYWLDERDHLRALLDARREYADALVYGQLGEEPTTSPEGAVAYRHVGGDHEVVVVADTSADGWTGTLSIGASAGGTRWADVLTDATYEAGADGTIAVELGEATDGIAVFVDVR